MTALTLDELKNYLHYEEADTSQDSALGLTLGAAQRWVENYTKHVLVQRLVTEAVLNLGDYHDLRWKPYVPETLTLTVIDGDYAENDDFINFHVFPIDGIWRAQPFTTWPTTNGGYALSYMAGYEEVYDIPEDLMLAVALHAAMPDQERADMSSQGWKSLYNLLEQYRLPTLA